MDDLWHVDRELYKAVYDDTIRKAPIELSPEIIHQISVPEAIALPHDYLTQNFRLSCHGSGDTRQRPTPRRQ
jgi:hypothetical protein